MPETPSTVAARVIGRERETELILAAVDAGRDLLLEGPPGTSKTTLLKAITDVWGIPLVFVEGNAELTPGRLLGHHDPARVLTDGYSEESFVPGPLVEAMQTGGFLYFEEFNRAPEDTLNALLTAIADRRVAIPRFGVVEALPSFRLIGSMNPFDNVGTTRLSVSIKDRLNRLVIDYQGAGEEERIVALRAAEAVEAAPDETIVADAVALARATRVHEHVVQGSSVRGAIDLALIAAQLCRRREVDPKDRVAYPDSFWDAMLLALSGRLSLEHAAGVDETGVLRDIWESHFVLRAAAPPDGARSGEIEDEDALRRPSDDPSDHANRPFRVKPKELDDEPRLAAGSGGVGTATGERGESGPRDIGDHRGGTSSDEAQLDDEEGETEGQSEAARARAREIARRLHLAAPSRQVRPRPGGDEILSVPYRGAGGELDLDRAVERMIESPAPRSDDLYVLERRRTRRQVVLAVDVSGSMRGERLLTAAATVGALSSGLQRDELAVVAFWSDAALLLRLGERVPLDRLVDEMVSLEAEGLTNVAFPLKIARRELGGPGASEQRVILLSDCVHNAGPDPREAASLLPRVDVLFDVEGERDSQMARGIARAGRGALYPIRDHREVCTALTEVLGRGDRARR
jgi:MoxR-like ATPase/Mg-chelatase subunit ChlD